MRRFCKREVLATFDGILGLWGSSGPYFDLKWDPNWVKHRRKAIKNRGGIWFSAQADHVLAHMYMSGNFKATL